MGASQDLRRVIKYSSMQAVLDSAAAATTDAEQRALEAEAAAIEALNSAGVDTNYISYETGVLPDSTGAEEGTVGAFFTSDSLWQKVEWDGAAWQNIGQPIVGFNRYESDLAKKASLKFIEKHLQVYATRSILNAQDLVTLDIGDDPLKDNTAALQELMDRPTRGEEIIVFPEGTIMHREITMKDSFGWKGQGEGTVFKLLPISQDDADNVYGKNDISVFNGNSNDLFCEDFVVDHNKSEHTATLSDKNCEGMDFGIGEFGYLRNIRVRNALGDGFDVDASQNFLFEYCSVDGAQEGFHNSAGSRNNTFKFCIARNCNGARGAFTSTENSLGENKFINCIAYRNGRTGGNSNYQILPSAEGKLNNVIVGCLSLPGDDTGGTDDQVGGDNVTGVPEEMQAAHYEINNIRSIVRARVDNRSQGCSLSDEVETRNPLLGTGAYDLEHICENSGTRRYTLNIEGSRLPQEIGSIIFLTMYSKREFTGGSTGQHQTTITIDGSTNVILTTGNKSASSGIYEAELSVAAIKTRRGWRPMGAKSETILQTP